MDKNPVSFKRGKQILTDNPFIPISGVDIDNTTYARIPVFKRGKGPYLYDYDENRFIDFDLLEGALLQGHAPPRLTSVVKAWIGRGHTGAFSYKVHQVLSKTLRQTLYPDPHQEMHLLYRDSVYEAQHVLSHVLQEADSSKRGVYVCQTRRDHAESYTSLPFVNHVAVTPDRVNSLERYSISHAIMKLDNSVDHDMLLQALEWFHDAYIPCFGDASVFSSFLHLKSLAGWHTQLDGVLFGNWLSAGLPFGAISFHNKALLHDNDIRTQGGAALFSGAGSPACYKLKAAQMNLNMLLKSGGCDSLLQKHKRFFSVLNKTYFQLSGGLVYVRDVKKLFKQYDDIHSFLFRAGFLFPSSRRVPLSLSFSHTDELLKKCAVSLNKLFQDYFQQASRT
jgi:hypothetical protein